VGEILVLRQVSAGKTEASVVFTIFGDFLKPKIRRKSMLAMHIYIACSLTLILEHLFFSNTKIMHTKL
jgi:hypothetical protein